MSLVRVNEFLRQEAPARFDRFVEVNRLVLGRVQIVPAQVIVRIINVQRRRLRRHVDLIIVIISRSPGRLLQPSLLEHRIHFLADFAFKLILKKKFYNIY